MALMTSTVNRSRAHSMGTTLLWLIAGSVTAYVIAGFVVGYHRGSSPFVTFALAQSGVVASAALFGRASSSNAGRTLFSAAVCVIFLVAFIAFYFPMSAVQCQEWIQQKVGL